MKFFNKIKNKLNILYQWLYAHYRSNLIMFNKNIIKTVKENDLTIVCIARGEERYLHEWIEFHLKQGVDLIVFYDNSVADVKARKVYRILKEFIIKNKLIYIRIKNFPKMRLGSVKNLDRSIFNTQELAYFHFKKYFSNVCKYYVKLDLDEYLYSLTGNIKTELNFKGSLGVWGYNFGSSGNDHYAEIPVTRRFLLRGEKLQHLKSISKSTDVYEFFNAHIAFLYPWKKITCNSVDLETPYLHENLRLNHYKMKSRAEFSDRKDVSNESYLYGDTSSAEFDELNSDLNIIYDDKILKFI